MIPVSPLKTPMAAPLARPVPRPLDLDPSCMLYYSMVDPLALGRVIDESGKGNDGTLVTVTGGTVNNEVITAAMDTWIQIKHQNLYVSPAPVLTNSDGTLTYDEDLDYRLNYVEGKIIFDSSFSAVNDGQSLLIDYTYDNLGPQWRPDGLGFNGLDNYVETTNNVTNLPTTEVTISVLQKVTSVKNQATFQLNPDTTSRINAYIPWSTSIVYWDFGNSSTIGRLSYTPPVSILNTWQYFTFVASQSGNYMKIYRNGVEEASKTGMDPYSGGPAKFTLGQASFTYFFNGTIAEVGIFNRAFSADEARAWSDRSRAWYGW